MKEYENIRSELEATLGSPLPEEAWQFLVEHSYINEIELGFNTIPGVAAEVRKLRRAFGQPVPEPDDATLMLDRKGNGPERNSLTQRLRAISVLLAHDAEQDPLVVDFRTSVLSGQLLRSDEVEDWIKQQAIADGKPTQLLNGVPLPSDAECQWDRTAGGWFTNPPMVIDRQHPTLGRISVKLLAYGVLEDPWQRVVKTTVGGVLEKLRQVSEYLAKQYGWQDAQATLFVLTRNIPAVSAIRATTQFRPFPVTTRITLTIDPTLTPREVAKHYANVRQKVLGKRYRALTEKHIGLAMFSATRPEEETWAERMAAWNKEYPKWRYMFEQVSNFRRDCLQAQRRLLHPDYQLRVLLQIMFWSGKVSDHLFDRPGNQDRDLRQPFQVAPLRRPDHLVDHTTIYRWVQQYAPELERRCKPHLKQTNDSWRVDETYIKVKGQWLYLYRAVDSAGNTLEFLLSETRDTQAAKGFFTKVLGASHTITPRVINVDQNPAYPRAVEELKAAGKLPQRCQLRPAKYLNNVIEQDHRFIKRLVKAGLGFCSFSTAWRTLRGYETMHMIRKGQVQVSGIQNQVKFVDSLFGLAA